MFLNSSLSGPSAKTDLLPIREREGGRFAACPHRTREKGNRSREQLHQRVQRDARTHGLMGEMTWTTDIWATSWPLPLFWEGNAAGSSLHHEVLHLQTYVSLLLPPIPLAIAWPGLPPLPTYLHTISTTRRYTQVQKRNERYLKKTGSVLKFLLIWEGEGSTQTLLN